MNWNGKIHDICIENCLCPFTDGQPFLIQIENCNDYFLPIFTTRKRLYTVMRHMEIKSCVKIDFSIKRIDNANDFLDSVSESGVRIMLDPDILEDHHTKWLEIIKAGDEYKLEKLLSKL